MGTYLLRVSYSPEGMKGVVEQGGTARRQAIEELLGGLGGTIESWYYAFGDDDLYVIVHAPSDVAVAAFNMRVAASGAASVHTTVLLSAEQIDEAVKTQVDYRPPGG